MAARPESQNSASDSQVAREVSKSVSPTVVAGEVAEDITFSVFDSVLNTTGESPAELKSKIQALCNDNNNLKLQNEQLQAALASSRNEKEEFETRNRIAQGTIESHAKQDDSLLQAKNASDSKLQALEGQLASSDGQRTKLEEELASSRARATASEAELSERRRLSVGAELGRKLNGQEGQPAGSQSREQELEVERNVLREQVSRLESQVVALQNQLTGLQARHAETQAIIAEQSDLAMRKEVSTAQPSIELPADSSEEKPLLAAAYQQISVLNTQLAHLYTELTMARTEVQRLRSEQTGHAGSRSIDQSGAGDSEAEVMKQSQQIADLVLDIRHLQLDLEYHQQKLDQMIEEKQVMMRDFKKVQGELEESKRQVEERDQMLKHRDVDIKQLKDEMKSPRGVGGGGGVSMADMEGEGTLAALRAEAAAKDSALIVSHYELHKEKLLRDRLEQKNLKLMERMQKLMMVVETMRKENVTLERNLVAREQNCETKEQQLRQVTQKAKQLQKIAKAAKQGGKGGSKTVLELGSPRGEQGLPPLDRSQRSVDSGGRRSGASTPRTPRCPPSPYGTR